MTIRAKHLTREYVRDLVVEIRCAWRDNLPNYAEKRERELSYLFSNRHGTRIDHYGMPYIPTEAQNDG